MLNTFGAGLDNECTAVLLVYYVTVMIDVKSS